MIGDWFFHFSFLFDRRGRLSRMNEEAVTVWKWISEMNESPVGWKEMEEKREEIDVIVRKGGRLREP